MNHHRKTAQPRVEVGKLSPEQALERYRYLVRTAPPGAIDEAHREAFSRLTPEQRMHAVKRLNAVVPRSERIPGPGRADPRALARLATRAELRQPGTMERALGQASLPGTSGDSLLTTLASSFVGTAIAQEFLAGAGNGHPAGFRDGDA